MTEKIKDINKAFQQFSVNFPNERLRIKMLDVCNEHPEYAADELLLLSEEILSQVSAYGVCLYLQHGGELQTEKNNDYILHDLFLHEGHQNAGPIFYCIRGIIQELSPENSKNDHVLSEKQNELFNIESEINKKLQELASFRNALMHGFFKLPAKRNEELVEEIQEILEKLLNHYKLFEHQADFHFWNNEGFSGNWKIKDNDGWTALAGEKATSFEKLADKAQNELHSPDFVKTVSISHEQNAAFEKKDVIEGFISSDFKESLYVQFHPRDKKQQDEFYENAYSLFKQKENVELLSYTIDENGIGFTSYLLIHQLLKKLGLQTYEKDPKQKIKSKVTELKKNGKKMIILINNIHQVPFASDHITSLMKFFKESGIHFIGIGWEYEHLNSIFSQKIDLRKVGNIMPDETEINLILKNHTRHRGPFEKEDGHADFKHIIQIIGDRLKDNKSVIARQLADEENLDIELINEALYILYPYFKYDQSGDDANYKKDDLDELYGFPKTQTETSSIFLTLGRRDIDLEYKHKILKP
jgi:hypothetical protein